MDYLNEIMNEALYPWWIPDFSQDEKESYSEYCQDEVDSALCEQREINNHE